MARDQADIPNGAVLVADVKFDGFGGVPGGDGEERMFDWSTFGHLLCGRGRMGRSVGNRVSVVRIRIPW